MELSTVSSCILTLHREFAAYTTQRLQELGLSFGLIYFVIYVGKHPDCTPSELTKDLHLDWGHSQRSLNKLAEDGFLTKEKNGRSYHLKLTQRGENAFVVCHQVFIDWDAQSLGGLTAQERQQLLTLLQKQCKRKCANDVRNDLESDPLWWDAAENRIILRRQHSGCRMKNTLQRSVPLHRAAVP